MRVRERVKEGEREGGRDTLVWVRVCINVLAAMILINMTSHKANTNVAAAH